MRFVTILGTTVVLVLVSLEWISAGPTLQKQNLTINKKAASGMHVRWETEKWPSGRIKAKIPYVNGKIHGEVIKYWDVNGSPVQARLQYRQGKKHGSMKTWHHNGNILSERSYVNDKLEGGDTGYHPAREGKVKTIRSWHNNKLEGREMRYDSQGRLRSEFNWHQGKKHGYVTVYGFQKEIKKREKWENGALLWRKKYEYYYLGGGETKKKSMETYNNASKLHGKCEYWRQPNIREKSLQYANGKLHGTCEFYDENGNIVRQEKWINGKKVRVQRMNVPKSSIRHKMN
jgi:antitoxin component YwqK of YwqJK toxin-antitoxin module